MNALPLILVVDDDIATIEGLAAALDPHYEVQFAQSAAEAMQRLAEPPLPQLMLLDVLLPDEDGYTVLARVKSDARWRDLPVIFVTALSNPAEEARGLDLGAADYITKPISPAIVRARVRNQLTVLHTRQQLQRLTLTDELTGIANRRHFDAAIAQEVERLRREPRPLGLVLLDIDHFKGYNDYYGHPAGDTCLKIVAQLLMQQAGRPGDLAARVGGEEFACLLPGTPPVGVLAVAERIRASLNAFHLPHATSVVAAHVTASIGVAVRDTWDEALADTLYREADQALYQAKQSGRNRVEAAAPLAQWA